MIVGADIGTQSLKAVVLNERLDVLGEHAVAYQPVLPQAGWAEQDPLLWERSLKPAIAGALQAARVSPDRVAGLGLGGQLDGCVAVGRDGLPLHPCLIWMDRRADAELAVLDTSTVQLLTGVIADASHQAAKILWLRRHVSAVRAAHKFHQPVSYLVSRLTGAHVIDHATASTSMVYGLNEQGYAKDLLSLFGIAEDLLPSPHPAHHKAGVLHAEGAQLTGLPPGVPVAVGTGDDFSSALGAGLVAPGRLLNVLGTAEVTGALHPKPSIDRQQLVETHAFIGDNYYIENPGWLSGGALTWFCKTFGLDDFAALDREASAVPAGADGVLFLPALSGAMAPEWNASARGAFTGLTASHGRGHMARAVLEAMAFSMRDVQERLVSMGVNTGALRIVGGGARSALWCQIRADVTGLAAEIPKHGDASPIGAALLAGVACGMFGSVEAAAARLQQDMRIVQPRHEAKPVYDQAHRRYRELYSTLKPLFTKAS